MHRALLLALLLALLTVPNAAATDGPDDLQECIGSGHWSTLPGRAVDCTQQCIGTGHWTTFPSRVVACLT